MPFESQWARIPLAVRWGVCLVVAVVLIALLVRFVSHHNGNALAHVSARNLRRESEQAQVLIGQDQAPQTVHVGASAGAALVAGVRADMRHRISTANIDGPLQRVRCGRTGAGAGRIAYHCLAEAGHVSYPFLAVVTPRTHRAVFCKKDFPPAPSENIPVSARCRL
jgi:hypothetical protein